jgi:hypothetical protein
MSANEPEDPVNPFAAPVTSAAIKPLAGDPDPLPPPKLSNVFAKWLVICGISAGPSFFFGYSVGNGRFPAVLGMVIGVMIFVVAYTALEFTSAVQQQMAKPVSRRAAWIAYLTRVGISIVFPVGIFVDVFCGIFAMGISSSVTGLQAGLGNSTSSPVPAAYECFQFVFTTVAQGILLNLVLFAFMGIAWVFCNSFSRD